MSLAVVRPAVAIKFLSPPLTSCCWYLLILFPSSITSLCPPHYWALDFFSSRCKKQPNVTFFWLSKAVFLLSQAEGDVRPPPATSRLAAARSSCFSRRPPAPSRAAPSVHQPADQEGGGVGPMPTPSIMVIFLCGQI